MKKLITYLSLLMGFSLISGCSVISAVATSNRIEEARAANTGKQLVPKDGGTYLIPIGTETASYLGSGNTDFKIDSIVFTQPKGTYSIIKALPGKYLIYANKRVAGGGEATATLELKNGEAACFYIVNPISAPARIEAVRNDVCDPFLRPFRNQNVIESINIAEVMPIKPANPPPAGASLVQGITTNNLPNPAKRLEDLNLMLKKGLITQQDYNLKKAEILRDM